MSLFIFKWSSTITPVLSKIRYHHLEGKLSRDHSDKKNKPTSECLQCKPSLFASGSRVCKGGIVYSCAPCCLVDSKHLIEERQESESTNGNVGTLCTSLVWMYEIGSEKSHLLWEPKTEYISFFAAFFFSRSSTRQHDYSAGTERENAQRHRYKMKPDRRYSAAS